MVIGTVHGPIPTKIDYPPSFVKDREGLLSVHPIT